MKSNILSSFKYVFLILIGLTLLKYIELYQFEFHQEYPLGKGLYWAQIKLGFIAILFGILIEWKKIIQAVHERIVPKIKVSIKIIPVLLMLSICFIPLKWFIWAHYLSLGFQFLKPCLVYTGIICIRMFLFLSLQEY